MTLACAFFKKTTAIRNGLSKLLKDFLGKENIFMT